LAEYVRELAALRLENEQLRQSVQTFSGLAHRLNVALRNLPGKADAMTNDSRLRAEILRALEWQPEVDPANIGVTVKDGVVTLFGSVASVPQQWAVEHTVLRVRGVSAVANEIDVTLPAEHERSDEHIARAAAAALESNVFVPRGRVQVMVRHGKVVLCGEVDWKYQRDAAVAAIRNLPGLRQLVNEIALRPRECPPDLKALVWQALVRSSEIDAGTISVDVVGGKVILRGATRTWGEREEAERVAWAAPGVAAVENELVVRIPEAVTS
jgi:osmotically-inducible protein OsmY